MKQAAKQTARWCGAALSALIVVAQPTAAPAAGAIALGRCDRIGWSNGYGSMGGARAEALEQCRSNGDGSCEVVVQVNGACAAVAISGNCGARGWAWSGSRGAAERMALRQCYNHGGSGCTIRRWICDGG